MSDNNRIPDLLPDLPDPAVVNKWTGQIRAWAGVAAMLGIAVPNLPNEKLQAYVTALLVAIGAATSAWSWFERRRQERAARSLAVDSAVASAKASAAAGEPVPVLVTVTQVTPPGRPNVGVAVPVPVGEVAVATIAPSAPGVTAADLNNAELRRQR